MVTTKELKMVKTPFLDNMLKRQMIGLFFLTFVMMSYLYATQEALEPSIEWFESSIGLFRIADEGILNTL